LQIQLHRETPHIAGQFVFVANDPSSGANIPPYFLLTPLRDIDDSTTGVGAVESSREKNMSKIFLVLSFFIFSTAHADLSGTYTGCGDFSTVGKQQIFFHLVKIPTGFNDEDFKYTAGFVMGKSSVASFFPEVQFNEDMSKMLMKVEIIPRHDYGLIIKAIRIQILKDQSLQGEFVANSAIPGEFAIHGAWAAIKVDPRKKMPVLKCN